MVLKSMLFCIVHFFSSLAYAKVDVSTELNSFKELFTFVQQKDWNNVFDYLLNENDRYDLKSDRNFKKMTQKKKQDYLNRLAKSLQNDPRLSSIREDIVFHYFLDRLKNIAINYGDDDDPPIFQDRCGDEANDGAKFPTSSDPIFEALKAIDSRIDRSVYIEGFGGVKSYKRFKDKLTYNGSIDLPYSASSTRFCFTKKRFWLTKIAEDWVKILLNRRASLDAAFAQGNLSLKDAVALANWYNDNLSGMGSLSADIKTAKLTKIDGEFHLSDRANQISKVVFDKKTKTVTSFLYYTEDISE